MQVVTESPMPNEEDAARLIWIRSVLDSLNCHALQFHIHPIQASKVLLSVAASYAITMGIGLDELHAVIDRAYSALQTSDSDGKN